MYPIGQSCGVDTFDTDSLSLFIGMPCWADAEPEDAQLRTRPLICVSTANSSDWQAGTQGEHETWIYFHDRRSWRGAHRLARMMLRDGGRITIHKGFAADLGGLETTAIVGLRHQLEIA